MFAPYFVSTGRITRNTVLTLLVSAVMSTSGLADTMEGMASEAKAATTPDPAVASPVAHKAGRIARAVFTSAIIDREPADTLDTFSADISRIFFFTDLRGLGGQIVTHRWEYDGQVMAEVTFKVGAGARWRVYSSKNLLPEWTGTWKVMINNESGETLHASTFEYVVATPAVAE